MKINLVVVEQVGPDNKPVVYFVGQQQGLVLNKTNARVLSNAYGDDFDHWGEKPVSLAVTMVEVHGEQKPSVRLVIPPAKPSDITEDSVPF